MIDTSNKEIQSHYDFIVVEKHAVLGGNAARLFPRLHSLVQSLPKDSKP